jgi:hypothetical protein
VHIEWAVGCRHAEAGEIGLNVVRLGEDSYDLTGQEIPCRVRFAFITCLRADPGDEQGIVYDYRAELTGPDGPQPPVPFRIDQRADSSPPLIDPERYYMPGTVDLLVTGPGQYDVRLVDATGERFALPVRIDALPQL